MELILADFFLRGFVEGRVYHTPVADLRRGIVEAIDWRLQRKTLASAKKLSFTPIKLFMVRCATVFQKIFNYSFRTFELREKSCFRIVNAVYVAITLFYYVDISTYLGYIIPNKQKCISLAL